MKTTQLTWGLLFAATLFAASSVLATTFTTNTAISAVNASYDGTDIVISNCTVTVDGAHSFNSLLVGPAGVLTHSFFPTGTGTPLVNVTNEIQELISTNPVTLLNTNVVGLVTVADSISATTYSNGVDYVQTNLPGGATQICRTSTSSIPDGETVLVGYTWSYNVNAGLNLTVTNDVTIASGGSINAIGIGYGPGLGSGQGFSSGGVYYDGSGGGYGGNGGISSSNRTGGICYGSVYQPVALGSGGGRSYAGNGGAGGGGIQIIGGGNVNIYGTISANGANAVNSRAGGGAGGSIWLTATNVNGTGSITVNGGAGEAGHGGGGGGGRISIQCGTNNFSGSVTAYGGAGWEIGGAGTIYTQTGGQTALLVVDNGGNVGTNSTIALPTLADVVIRGGAGVIPNGTFSPNNLTIATNCLLTTTPLTALNLTIASNLTVQAGGVLVLDLLGYGAGSGTAPGGSYSVNGNPVTGGGGHGGYGGAGSVTNANGGGTYDSQTLPASFGSGGGNPSIVSVIPGGLGGGVVQLNVAGTAQVDGLITANGGNGLYTGGGGSGGSIYISCATFAGAGSITAKGGNGVGSISGGGGGGRIAVFSQSSAFSGTVSASGGAGANYGGAGTVYLSAPESLPPRLILDNAGHVGANTLLQSASSANLIVQNGASGTANTGVTFASLLVGSNSWLTTYSPNSSENFTITGNATLQAGGGFMANFGGSGSSGGNSPGGNSGIYPYACGGGGHGGAGGNSFSNSAAGGNVTSDSVANPGTIYTAGGGGGYPQYSIGGSAGGYVRMTVNGALQLNGLISANGGNGSGLGGGGGAGGGIYLTSGTFTGSGTISANGGYGANSLGGGGGGGMIAVYFNNNSFTGNISAYGGGGANWGGAGTIYLKTNSANYAQLIIDNAGNVGANSAYAPSADITLRNGGRSYLSTGTSFNNLVIGSNALLVATNASYGGVIAAANVTVQAGGSISADSGGYIQNSGNGHGNYYYASPYYQCSGAGHAGYGGNAFSNAAVGGLTYDSYNSPNTAGSGGGGDAPYSVGGNGGGLIQMNLSGNLQVDGTLSANGGNGSGAGGGGGSGGSLNINCRGLAGSGTIAANGGSGANVYGGGGGGGVIAVAFTTNSFAGTISAYGGGGASYGGAGTIYFKTNTTGQALFIVDNGGHRGTNTPVQQNTTYNLVLRNGAVAVPSYTSENYSSLWIGSNAWLFGVLNAGYSINSTITGNATIQSGGGITVDGGGNTQNSGSGHGFFYSGSPWYQCSGAGHGGYGGSALSNAVSGGITYDSTASPNALGSGGGGYLPYSIGGSGGGYVILHVNGTLQVDGSISANGYNGSAGGGGGSGGTIYLTASSLAGAGSISANGGSGGSMIGGGGGGGRIAIYNTAKTNSFTGTISAYGGAGANYGGAGTIYYAAFGNTPPQLILDNGGNAGTNTTFDLNFMDVTVQNGAIGTLPQSFGWSLDNLTIHTNSTITAQASGSNRTISAKNITIDAGAALQVDGGGYPSLTGPGAGSSAISISSVSGGAGHGGFGGGNPLSTGIAYDSIQNPTAAGSGGGNYPNVPSNGNSGGGALTLSVNGILTVNGRLSANGNSGIYNTGGGSGGSLNLDFINLLAGKGVISANGGSATGSAGGGGGGRIAIVGASNIFTGLISAFGGNGTPPGGAGTIYTSIGGGETLLVNNGGLAGTNTPLGSGYSLPSSPFNLNVSGAANVGLVSTLPLLNNFNLAAGATLTVQSAPTNLTLTVQNNADIAGDVVMDTFGNIQAKGPGAGSSNDLNGSGGGYGGSGGSSATDAPGGATYGSATEPVDLGSGGGMGFSTATGGSEGGGALRISVGGTLNIDGNVSANGDYGWQDNSGGGSGGSVWITANTLSGAGTISAQGGEGAPAGGSGGGGGRIAIYAPTNSFTGTTNANGGTGYLPGQPGTIFLANILPAFLADNQSPTGLVNNTVSTVDVFFNEAVNPASVSVAAFTLTTPAGVIPTSSLGIAFPGANDVELSFPTQNTPGNYSIQVSPTIANILGVPLAQAYGGTFTISLPTISGTVTDTNNAPVAGVTLQPDGGLSAATTDTNGNYSIGVPPGWNGTITPSFGTFMFVASAMTYTNVTASITNQNYLLVPTIAPNLTTSLNGANPSLTWPGMSGVTYQAWSSTNLVNWVPYGNSIAGTNGTQQILLPVNTSPAMYFRIGASD